jgi:hypothetical protein
VLIYGCIAIEFRNQKSQIKNQKSFFMAHKKGEGSVKNGRDSQSKRLGVKIYGGQPLLLVISSFVNAALFIIPVKTLALVKTLHCLHSPMVLLNSEKHAPIEASFR